ncbi:MAG: ribonuclease HI family protein [Gemmatimonadota bacterium]|nr:ribonuclease HI family protein [Gemmatimonadota bacterium]
MSFFEVFLVVRVGSGDGCLVEKQGASSPSVRLKPGQDWQEALEGFIRDSVGVGLPGSRLLEVKSVTDGAGKSPVLELHVEAVLGSGQPQPVDERYHWVQKGRPGPGDSLKPLEVTGSLDPEREVELYTDGGSRGNPGPAGIGVLLCQKDTNYREQYCRYIGRATNNTAEYTALVEGLRLAVERGAKRVAHLSDSQLLVRQLTGRYRVKSDDLKLILYKAKDIIAGLDSFSTTHIRRELNSAADSLAGRAMDEANRAANSPRS